MRSVNIWLERPPFAIVGFLRPLKTLLKESLRIFIKKDSATNRNGLDQNNISELNCVYVDNNLKDINEMNVFSNSINIVNGFNSFVLDFLIKKKKEDKTILIGCYTEMPSAMGHFKSFKKQLLKIKYSKIINDYISNVDFLLPIGSMASNYFKNIGWNKPSFPFVYIPDVLLDTYPRRMHDFRTGSYCYIGRNDFSNKGLGKVIRFFVKHPNLKVIIIGNYGNDCKKVHAMCNKYPNMQQLPSMHPSDVIKFIKQSNIKSILVPSNTDGWNPNVYMSLLSGTPCIATINTGSSDLISKYKFGFVCSASYQSLKKCILKMESLSDDELKELFDNAYEGSKECLPERYANELLGFLKNISKDD